MIFYLLVVYQIKHFLADFPLQGKYMLNKFQPGWDFLLPLTAHAAIHALFTFIISLSYLFHKTYPLMDIELPLKLALLDFVVHFTMDRIKAGPKYLGRFKDMYNYKFWWSLGLDQMVHHLTHYFIIYQLVK